MKYDLSNRQELKSAKEYFTKLEEKGYVVEISRKAPRRTYNQNNYLHLLLSYCALEYGETREYFKEFVWKRYINKDIFETVYVNPKSGEVREDWRSSAELTTKEMSIAVDRLISFASKEMGLHLPEANHFSALRKMENEIEMNAKYL